jgi:hypothetical protein
MEPTVTIEIIHHSVGVAPGGGSTTLTLPPAADTSVPPSPFFDPDHERIGTLETMVDNLSTLLDLTVNRMEGHWKAIKQLESKLLELDRDVKRQEAMLRDLLLAPRSRRQAQQAGIGRS